MIDLNKLASKMHEVSKKREENGAFGKVQDCSKELLKHCATEVVEAAEAYYSYKMMKDFTSGGTDYEGLEEPDSAEKTYLEDRENFISELSDIIACVFIIAAEEHIDIEDALQKSYDKNKARAEKNGDKL